MKKKSFNEIFHYRSCLIRCFVTLMMLSLTVGNHVMAQADKKISISVENALIRGVLEQLQKEVGVTFVYEEAIVSSTRKVSLKFQDASLTRVLDELCRQISLRYEVKRDLVLLLPLKPGTSSNKREMIKLCGRVTDTKKQAIPGVTVIVKGVTLGTVTNVDGMYSLTLPKVEILTLLFSFIGMETQEIKYTGRDTINVVMNDAVNEMDEVTVVSTGYQNVNRRDMVGSYSTLKADDIKIAAYSNISDMLQGQVAGMIVTRTSPRAGASPKIKIRGTATLGNTDPIFVVDGIIQDDPVRFNAKIGNIDDMENIIGSQISWLNPSDIETITVLKDASATAIYGARASNGVIVVTTKRPKSGDRISINYTGSLNVSPRPTYSMFNLMNSQERVEFSEEAFAAGAKYSQEPYPDMNTFEGTMRLFFDNKISDTRYSERRSYFETLNTDWFKLLTRTAITHNHNLSVGGSSEKATYLFSLGYNKDEGQEKGNSSERFTSRASVNMRLRENVRLAFNINATIGKNVGYANGVNPLIYATNTSRAVPAFEEDGSYAYYQRYHSYRYNKESRVLSYNIMNEMENSKSMVKNGRVSVGVDFSWDVTTWLKYQFTGGYSYNGTNTDRYSTEQSFFIANTFRGYDYNSIDSSNPWYTAAQLPHGGELFSASGTQHSYNIQNKLLIQKNFNEDHRLNIMLGTEVRSAMNRNTQNTFWGYVPDRGHQFVKPTVPESIKPVGSTSAPDGFSIFNLLYEGRASIAERTDSFFSLFATLAYSLKDKYVFNCSIRNDASNRFGQSANGHFDPIYSFGLSWRVSGEAWMEPFAKVISNLNLKATYGIQGNADLTKSPDLVLKMGGVKKFYNTYYSTIQSIPNPDLSWERTHSLNLGVELRLFDYFNVVADYYTRRSNAVISQDIPYENGMAKMSINGGWLYNKGYEVTVSFNPVNHKDYGLNFSVNASRNWNEGGKTPFEATYGNYLTGISTSILKEGYPVNGFWSYAFTGLNPSNGIPMFGNMAVDAMEAQADPTKVLVYSGSKEPDFTGGLNLGIRYKSLTLSSSFALLLGGHKRLPSPYRDFYSGVQIPEATANLTKELMKRWREPGDETRTDIPAIITGRHAMDTPFAGGVNMITQLYENSDVLVASSSFLRCRNLGVTWRMDPEQVKKIGLTSLMATVSASNLFVITSKRYQGLDPELDESVMPKSYSVSLSIGF